MTSWLRGLLKRKSAPSSEAKNVELTAKADAIPAAPRRAITGSLEGLQMDLNRGGVVRAARIAAMNDEHRELVITVDCVKWAALTNSARQRAATVARTTWAAQVCGTGPDIAYLTIVDTSGTTVAQADPHAIRVA
jgi:hypothetical protein